MTAGVGYINTPFFNQNIFLNPYTVNTALPVTGYLGNTLTGANIVSNTTLTSVFNPLSVITLPKGVWILVGYATIDCNNNNNVDAVLAITDSTNTFVINNYAVNITGQNEVRGNRFNLHLTGIICVTATTTYDLSAETDASLSGDIFAVGSLTKFVATRIA